MNLDQIATKCFILALFIRDDGERLLLGDGFYDFKSNLQHFQGNTIANDIVEIQGDNGQLLAGQVMRSGAQKFEGYIGDATTSRQIIEQKRSDFMAFFRIKHFYKVVYIFPDGTAIQRQRGYLTDAPTIPEIFQKFPEYSIALNFEDANYYEYAEDEHGDEIYAHIAELALAGGATGGLVWDAIGAVSNGISWSGIQTAQGEYIQITNELSLEAPLASVEMLGNATQDGTPTPDSPVAVQTTTGENVVKIEGKNLFNQGQYDDASGNYGLSASFSSEAINLSGTSASDAWPAFTMYASGQLEASRYWPATSQIMTWRGAFNEAGNYRFTIWVDGNRGTADANFRYIIGYMDGTVENRYFPLTDRSQVYSITKPINFISVGTANNVAVDCSVRIQLEKGTSGSSFEPYQAQEFEVNLGKNLFSISQDTIITNAYLTNNTTLTFDNLNSVKFVATGTQGAQYLYRIISGLDSTKSYTFSFKAIKNVKGSTGLSYIRITTSGSNDGSTWTNLGVSGDTNPTEGTTYSFAKTLTGYSQYRFMIFNNADTPVQIGETTTYFDMQLEEGAQTSFASYFTSIELAKIGNYQDRIYKDEGKWYIEKQVGKVVLDGTETWTTASTNISGRVRTRTTAIANLVARPTSGNVAGDAISDHFVIATSGRNWEGDQSFCIETNGNMSFYADGTQTQSVSNWTTWLASNPTTVYYALATPTTTEITNEALIAQLDALESASLYLGVNNIGTETQNAVPTLKIEYYTEVDLEGAGYEWEPGGNTAKTIVTVAGVDSAWPIWTVQGGAQNPTLTNITTGQTISWQGFVPEGQTLTINMAEMTADLAGANVFEYITGEWIRLAPGNNTLVYTAGSADKPSTLSWNGVLA